MMKTEESPTNRTAAVIDVRFDHLNGNTLGIGNARPRLSWRIVSAAQNWQQAAYEIALYDGDGTRQATTGRVSSADSIHLPWPFPPLQSRQQCSVRVRVYDQHDQPSEWSEPASVEVGLLAKTDWQAQFITPDWDEDTSQPQPAPLLRRAFAVRPNLKHARLYISALGVYEANINGQAVGDAVLAPGWTVYSERLRYHTFDVTDLLDEGNNVLGALLGDGWYRGRLGFHGGQRNIYGDRLALLAQLELVYADGSAERILTDEKWRATTGAIRASDLYDGETYDARLERTGWSMPDYDARDWAGVRPVAHDFDTLIAPTTPLVRRIEEITPHAILTSPTGRTIVDFGQNIVGRVRIVVEGEAGHTVTLRHAEVLENGGLGIRPLRLAKATDHYTLRGDGRETYEPHFTFHGFRYVEVENWPGELRPDAITAIVLHSDMVQSGTFSCSDPLLNQLHANIIWGMRGNFLDVPTDCPQRDERLGWTGDIQVFAPTATYLYDVAGFLQSWLADLAADQAKLNGAVPHVVPDILSEGGAAAWGDAAVVVPWVLYQRYGDRTILADQFDSMTAWVDHIASKAGESYLWDTGFQFGDWLDPTAPPERPGEARTAKEIVATAYFAYSADLVAQAATVLERPEAHAQYAALAKRVKAAFARRYVTPDGRMMSDAETAYALAIVFELLESAEQRQHAGNRLAQLVKLSGYHIRTGFVGTPLICDALCLTGHRDTAYQLLLQQECPSWLYPVTMGATTVWERWDSMLPDGSINPGEMTSFNHYALGAVADWMHRTIGGIALGQPGYRHIEFAPQPGGQLTCCQTTLQTPYGKTACKWQIVDGMIELHVTVPPNCTATVHIPNTTLAPIPIGSGDYSWTVPYTDPVAM